MRIVCRSGVRQSGQALRPMVQSAHRQMWPQGTVACVAAASRQMTHSADAFAGAGLTAILPRVGPLLGVFFGPTAPTNFDEAEALAENGAYPKVFHALLERGVALAPGAYEALFPSLAHDDEVVEATISAAADAAAAVVA